MNEEYLGSVPPQTSTDNAVTPTPTVQPSHDKILRSTDNYTFGEKTYTMRTPQNYVPNNGYPEQNPAAINRNPVQSTVPQGGYPQQNPAAVNRNPVQSTVPQGGYPQQNPAAINRNPVQSTVPQGGYYNRPQYPQPPRPPYQQPYQPYPPQPSYAAAPGGYQYYYRPSPQEIEKENLHKSFSFAGKSTLILLGSLYLVAIIIALVGFFSGIVQDTPTLHDPYAGFTPIGFYAYEGLSSLLGLFVPAIILAKASKVSMNELFPFKKLEGKYLAALVFAGMAVCMIAQLAVSLLVNNMYIFGIDIESALDQESATGLADIMLSAVCTAVIPALVEEFAFRGVVLGVLKKHDEMFAIFASAFLFGLLHGNFVQIPFAFMVGLVAAFVRVKSDSMLPSILIHFGNNFFAVLMTASSELLPDPIDTLVEDGVMLLLILVGIFAIYYLVKNHKEIFEPQKSNTTFKFRELTKQFLSTGTVIACMVLLILSSLVLVSAV